MKLMDVAIYLVYVATYIIIIPIGVGVYFFKTLPKTLKILFWGLWLVFFLDLLLVFFNLKVTNTFLYLFSIVDVLMMGWIFSSVINGENAKKTIIFISMAFIPFIGLDAFFISGITNNGFSNALEKIYILVIALYYLTQLFQEQIESNLLKKPVFWLSIGVISYNLVGSFDLFNKAIVNYSQTLYLQYYVFWSIVTIFMYATFSYAFWLRDDAQL